MFSQILLEEIGSPTVPASMFTGNGIEVKETEEKLQTFVDFYEDLYKSFSPKSEKAMELLENIEISKISEDHQRSLTMSEHKIV